MKITNIGVLLTIFWTRRGVLFYRPTDGACYGISILPQLDARDNDEAFVYKLMDRIGEEK